MSLFYTKIARSHTMADSHNIPALIHGLWLRSFLYSFTNPSVDFVCRNTEVWNHQVCYLQLLNCFFSLIPFLIVNDLSRL
jgi:hypothetical protein